MPFQFSWTLASPPVFPVAVPTASMIPVFPLAGAQLPCNAVMYDYEHFLRLFDRVIPYEYLEPMKLSDIGGYELFRANAAIGERVSLAVERFECGSFAIFAEGGNRASGFVQFWRPTAAAGAITIKAGTVVRTADGGRDFVTLLDVSFGALDVGPIEAEVQAVAAGYEWNVRGTVVTESGIVLEGAITDIPRLVTDPPYGDITIYVRQVLDTTGGTAPMLDGLGEDKGLPRAPAEPDNQYRLRVRSLPDTVSPDAINRNVREYLANYGVGYEYIETWEILYQTCWDAPSSNVGTPTYQAVPPTNPDYDENHFAFDDERPESELRDVWLDEREFRGAFIVAVDLLTINDVGLAYDDPGMQPSDFRDPATGYGRGTSSFDILPSYDTALIYSCFWDGYDVARAALFSGLYELLQRVKPAGVAAIIVEARGI